MITEKEITEILGVVTLIVKGELKIYSDWERDMAKAIIENIKVGEK